MLCTGMVYVDQEGLDANYIPQGGMAEESLSLSFEQTHENANALLC
jgi:hypothetical protein